MKRINNLLYIILAIFALLVVGCKSDNEDVPNEVVSPFTLAQSEISIKPGESVEVAITGGSGTFLTYIENVGIVSASANAERVQIQAHAEGVETLIVQDKKSGEKKEIKITVAGQNALTASLPELVLYSGSIKVFHINDGSGDYMVEVSDSELIEVLSVDGSKITIKGKNIGSTTLKITDNVNGSTLELPATISMRTLKVGQNELTTKIGDVSSISIEGNGKYEVSASTPNIVEPTIQAYALSLKAIGVGETTLTLTDVIANETQEIHVVVEPRDLILEKNDVQMTVLASVTVKILDGSGEYELEVIEGADLITPSLDGSIITLEPLGPTGDAVLKVKDVLSGYEQLINITVTERIMKIKLNVESITIHVGQQANLKILETDWMLVYYSKVNYDEEYLDLPRIDGGEWLVRGKRPGSTIITITDYYGTEILAQVPVTILP